MTFTGMVALVLLVISGIGFFTSLLLTENNPNRLLIVTVLTGIFIVFLGALMLLPV
jgi:ABC-type multidrug transport system permease subunit